MPMDSDVILEEALKLPAKLRGKIAAGFLASLDDEAVIAGGKGQFFPFDLGNSKGIHEFVKQVTDKCGPLYGLINNAALGHDGLLATQHETQIEELIRVNVQAPVLLAKYASRSMLIGGEGRIIQVSSIIVE